MRRCHAPLTGTVHSVLCNHPLSLCAEEINFVVNSCHVFYIRYLMMETETGHLHVTFYSMLRADSFYGVGIKSHTSAFFLDIEVPRQVN